MRRAPRRRLQHPSAVEREPREQVDRTDQQVEPRELAHDLAHQPWPHRRGHRREDACQDERGQRPDRGDDELREGPLRVRPRLGRAAPEHERDPHHGKTERSRGDRVRGLVEQDPAEEQHAFEQRQPRRPGRGRSPDRVREARVDQERVQGRDPDP